LTVAIYNIMAADDINIAVKGKAIPVTGHEGP
jgi:hypothetical protein